MKYLVTGTYDLELMICMVIITEVSPTLELADVREAIDQFQLTESQRISFYLCHDLREALIAKGVMSEFVWANDE